MSSGSNSKSREKDHDITWLYGPLQTGPKFLQCPAGPQLSQLSKRNSFASKKPILKKRSPSEIVLQKSLTSSTLVKQATDALQAQQPERGRPALEGRALSDFVIRSHPKRPDPNPIMSPPAALGSASTSGARTPCTERHIHFNNKVEQCIAINKGRDDQYDYFGAIDDDSSSEDEPLTMKPVRRPNPGLSTPRSSFSGESKTIAMLPSTTLNYRGDTPEPAESKSNPRSSFWNASPKISPCPSQRTITPRAPSTNFLLGDDDEDADLEWEPSLHRRNSLDLRQRQSSATKDEYDLDQEHSTGSRRTPSGMFIPYKEEQEEEKDDFASAGLVATVVNTVNTAKDIAHVIWNVGWRR